MGGPLYSWALENASKPIMISTKFRKKTFTDRNSRAGSVELSPQGSLGRDSITRGIGLTYPVLTPRDSERTIDSDLNINVDLENSAQDTGMLNPVIEGINKKEKKVLILRGMKLPRGYDDLVNAMKKYGTTLRIAQREYEHQYLSLPVSWNCTMWFKEKEAAYLAEQDMEVLLKHYKCVKIYTALENNVKKSRKDFIPERPVTTKPREIKVEDLVMKRWWRVGLKKGANILLAYRNLTRVLGPMEEGTVKRYNRGFLLDAAENLHKHILREMSERDWRNDVYVEYVSQHKSFNRTT